MPKHKAVAAMLAMEALRDCGLLAGKQYLKMCQMCEELKKLHRELVMEDLCL